MKKNTPKVILITGGSSGIGRDSAIHLASRGHHVYAAARRTQLLETLREYGVTPLHLDVTDNASMQACVDAVLKAEGHIDVLVNNAGYGQFGAVENVTLDEARRQLEVNVFGLARMSQLVLPSMRSRHSGRIINISSVVGRTVIYFGGWYHVSKYSVEALSDSMRLELAPLGIDVVKIQPGAIKTEWGIIAADHLRDSSLGTPYETDATRWADAMRWGYSSPYFSKPSVITRDITHAVESRRPRTHYLTGRFAHIMVVMHNLLPPRWWDALMRTFAKVKVK